MAGDSGILAALLAGVGGGSAVVAIAWAAVRWWLQGEFVTQREGEDQAAQIAQVRGVLESIRGGLVDMERRTGRIEEIVASDLSPQWRKQGEQLIRVREELAVMRTTVSHVLDNMRDVHRRQRQ